MENYTENKVVGRNQRNYRVTDVVLALLFGGIVTLGIIFMIRMLLIAGGSN